MTDDPVAAAARRLSANGIDSARLDARLLWAHAQRSNPPLEGGSNLAAPNSRRGAAQRQTNYPSPKSSRTTFEKISTLPQGEGDVLERFESLVSRRLAREPVAYIVGQKEFWSLDFAVGPGVLIPRPDTEILIEELRRTLPDCHAQLSILDLGTGSGCLLIAALGEYPNAHGVGVDASAEALNWAAKNLARHNLEDRASLIESGWLDEATPGFDVLLCNPPYVATPDIAGLEPDVRLYEPIVALDGGPDGLDAYRALAPRISRLLAPSGTAFLEIGAGQSGQVRPIVQSEHLKVAAITPDLGGIPRCLVLNQDNQDG